MQRPRPARVPPPTRPLPPVRAMRRAPEPPGASALRATGVLTVLAAAAFVVLHGLALATAPKAAARTLHATLPALTDLDQALAAHAQDIAATAGGGDESIPVPGLPLRVAVPRQAAAAGGEELRRATVDAMTRTVYAEGQAAFRVPDAPAEGALALFSSQWAVRRTLDTLTRGAHQKLVWMRTALAVALVALLVLLALQVDGPRRLLAVGSALAMGAALAAAGALLARLAVWLFTSGDGGVAGAVVAGTARDLAMTVAVTAAIAVIAGLALAACGTAVSRVTTDAPRTGTAQPRELQGRLLREPWEET